MYVQLLPKPGMQTSMISLEHGDIVAQMNMEILRHKRIWRYCGTNEQGDIVAQVYERGDIVAQAYEHGDILAQTNMEILWHKRT